MNYNDNYANYQKQANWQDTKEGNFTTVGTNGGPSAYGTYDQSGNVWELCDINATINSFYCRRGGSCQKNEYAISSKYRCLNTSLDEHETIGFRQASVANVFSFDKFVHIGDEGNHSDTTGYGSVGYCYYMSKYPLTNYEYSQFLNAIDPEGYNPQGIYHWKMTDHILGGIIFDLNADNGKKYAVKPHMQNKPVNFINWFDCARYCNWLHNKKPIFTSTSNAANSINSGAYEVGTNIKGNTVAKNSNAKYHIPTEDEWYKAAYYKGQSTDAGYWLYATQSDTAPTPVHANDIGDAIWD